MVKLTPDLIENARQFINPVQDRELDLRGFKIPAIENLGAAYDQFDSIDLCDNDVKKLENFPYCYRLKRLYLANNRIAQIAPELPQSIPNVDTIVLTNNNLMELGDLDPLANFQKLEYLSLLGNPVAHKPHYRLYIIYKIPQLRVLDFRRIRQSERQSAKEAFKGKAGRALREEIVKKTKNFNVGEVVETKQANGQQRHTQDEILAIRQAIEEAKSLEEVDKLQQQLQAGQVPGATPAPSGDRQHEVPQEDEMDED